MPIFCGKTCIDPQNDSDSFKAATPPTQDLAPLRLPAPDQTITPSTADQAKCVAPKDDLRAPPTGVEKLPELTPAINLDYYYDDDDVHRILSQKLAEPLKSGKIHLGTAAESFDRLQYNISDWREACATSTPDAEPTLLIQPYSESPDYGAPSNHWTVLILAESPKGEDTDQQRTPSTTTNMLATYIDPLGEQTPIPKSLRTFLQHCLPNTDIQEKLITHTRQRDGASCGPRIVEDSVEIGQYFSAHNTLPDTLQNATARDAQALRADHIALLGGDESTFALKQRHWAPAATRHTVETSELLGILRENLLIIFTQLTELQHRALCANPSLQTFLDLGFRFPEDLEPWRDWANRFLSNFAAIYSTQHGLLASLQSCAQRDPELYDVLAHTWQHSPEGPAISKTLRDTMRTRISASTPDFWLTPQAQALTALSEAFFKDFKLTSDTTPAQLENTEAVDMEIMEWVLSHTFDAPLSAATLDAHNAAQSKQGTRVEQHQSAPSAGSDLSEDSFDSTLAGLYS